MGDYHYPGPFAAETVPTWTIPSPTMYVVRPTTETAPRLAATRTATLASASIASVSEILWSSFSIPVLHITGLLISYKLYGLLSHALITAPQPDQESLRPSSTQLSWYKEVHRCCQCHGGWILQQVAMVVHIMIRYGCGAPVVLEYLSFDDLYPGWGHAKTLCSLCSIGGVMLALLLLKHGNQSLECLWQRPFNVKACLDRRENRSRQQSREPLNKEIEDPRPTAELLHSRQEQLAAFRKIKDMREKSYFLHLEQEQYATQNMCQRNPSRRDPRIIGRTAMPNAMIETGILRRRSLNIRRRRSVATRQGWTMTSDEEGTFCLS